MVMSSGLDDVVVAETVLSEVDGNAGRLVIRVYSDGNPGPGFEPVTPDLEDVFFTKIKAWT